MAVDMVSIRSKELKINGITSDKFPFIRSTNLPFLDNSRPVPLVTSESYKILLGYLEYTA